MGPAGAGIGVILPKDVLARLKLVKGDTVFLTDAVSDCSVPSKKRRRNGRHRHSHCAGAAGALRRFRHHDLHPCSQGGCRGCGQPVGCAQSRCVMNVGYRCGPGSENSLDQPFTFDHQQLGRLTGGDRHIAVFQNGRQAWGRRHVRTQDDAALNSVRVPPQRALPSAGDMSGTVCGSVIGPNKPSRREDC